MLVTERFNIGAQVKAGYAAGNTAAADGKPAEEEKEYGKEAELILSDNAKQKQSVQEDAAGADIWGVEYNYTPQEAAEVIRAANETILGNASEAVLAQANQDAGTVAELLSA